MNFSFYIAKRYLISKNGNNIINIVTILACLGVAAGTAALFLVLSVFSGIKNYSLNVLDITTPDIRISPKVGKTISFDKINPTLKKCPGKIHYSRIIAEKAFLKHQNKEEIALIKGVDHDYQNITPADSLIFVGEWINNQQNNTCVLSYPLALKLELKVYADLVQIYVPKAGTGYFTNPDDAFRNIDPVIIGVSSLQSNNDDKIAYLPLSLSQKLLGLQANQVSYIDIRVKNINNLDNILNYLKTALPNYKISPNIEINSGFYKILNSEKLIAYLVSLLVVFMVLSNTIGTIIMVIVDKKQNIQTFIKMGTSLQKVREIFIYYGFLLTLTGLMIGLSLGIVLVFLQNHYHFIMITTTTAYPIAFEWSNTLIVITTVILFGAVSSIIASSRISKKFIHQK